MRVGIKLPTSGPNAAPANIARTARLAEELGFHSLWVSDHIVLPAPEDVQSAYPYGHRWMAEASRPFCDPLTTLAWVAPLAPSLVLGTSVLVLPLRNPLVLANEAATLDYLTEGRLLLGLGVGWLKEEFDFVGVPFGDRGARSDEMVGLMRALWTGERVSVRGERWAVDGGTMQPAPPRGTVPILWGGESEATFRRVARLGDGWHPLGLDLDAIDAGIKRIAEHCRASGRDPRSIQVIPNPRGELEPRTLEALARLGVDHVVVSANSAPGIDALHEGMHGLAERCGLERRPG